MMKCTCKFESKNDKPADYPAFYEYITDSLTEHLGGLIVLMVKDRTGIVVSPPINGSYDVGYWNNIWYMRNFRRISGSVIIDID